MILYKTRLMFYIESGIQWNINYTGYEQHCQTLLYSKIK